jgi:hypothetical protein
MKRFKKRSEGGRGFESERQGFLLWEGAGTDHTLAKQDLLTFDHI